MVRLGHLRRHRGSGRRPELIAQPLDAHDQPDVLDLRGVLRVVAADEVLDVAPDLVPDGRALDQEFLLAAQLARFLSGLR